MLILKTKTAMKSCLIAPEAWLFPLDVTQCSWNKIGLDISRIKFINAFYNNPNKQSSKLKNR